MKKNLDFRHITVLVHGSQYGFIRGRAFDSEYRILTSILSLEHPIGSAHEEEFGLPAYYSIGSCVPVTLEQ